MNILQNSSTPRHSPKHKRVAVLAVCLFLAVGAFVWSIVLGSTDVSLGGAVRDLLMGTTDSADFKIVFYLRLPRALGAFLSGAALAVSGVMLQAVLNNPMAAPNLIGVNAGAGFFVILAMAVFPRMIGYLPLAAFVGALLAALLIYAISAVTDAGKVTVTLVGVAVSSILTAAINMVKHRLTGIPPFFEKYNRGIK